MSYKADSEGNFIKTNEKPKIALDNINKIRNEVGLKNIKNPVNDIDTVLDYNQCPRCKSKKIYNEFRLFKKEKLNVLVCGSCRYWDWIIPKTIRDKDMPYDHPLFEESLQWARLEASLILKENKAFDVFIAYSKSLDRLLGKRKESVGKIINELGLELGSNKISVGQYQMDGIRIVILDAKSIPIEVCL